MFPISGIRTCSALAIWCALASCAEPPALSRGVIHGKVVLGSEPIVGATVAAYRLDDAGEVSSAEPIATAITEDATGEPGAFRLDMGASHGTILLLARGGSTHEHWAPSPQPLTFPFDDTEPPGDSRQLRAVIPDYTPVARRQAAITPFTTLAAALAQGRRAAKLEPTYRHAAERANELMSAHIGIDILATLPADVRAPANELSAAVAYGLALAGLSALAGRIEAETPNSILVVNTMTLTAALADDARADTPAPVFDGIGSEGVIEMGVCIPPPECTGPDECPLCELASRTLRRDLAESLLFWFVPSEHNGTGLALMDVAFMALGIGENIDRDLFGMASAEPLDTEPPRIDVLPSPIHDERGDEITFDIHAAPMHEPIGQIIDLSVDNQCPTVFKHVNRMDSAEQNPLRWRFAVADDGAGVRSVEYRVRNMSSGQWLTEWTPAPPVLGGVEHDVVLLRQDIPALASTEATMEIQFRARDWFENVSAPVSRCWQHVPLAAPLRVGQAVMATGPGSLLAVDIDPDTYDLSALLNATTEREIMWFDVQNGTDEPVFVTFNHAQLAAQYDLTWQYTNVMISSGAAPPGCTTDINGTCPLLWPSGYESEEAVLVNQPFPLDAWTLRVWDMTASVPAPMETCDGCDVNEYRLEPRIDPTRPRRYRVSLVVDDLGILAPLYPSEPIEVYEEIALDPIFPTLIITGKRYGTLTKCFNGQPSACMEIATYRRYRAIRSASLRSSPATITGRVAPTASISPRLPSSHPETFGTPPSIPSFQWTVNELALPDADPPL